MSDYDKYSQRGKREYVVDRNANFVLLVISEKLDLNQIS